MTTLRAAVAASLTYLIPCTAPVFGQAFLGNPVPPNLEATDVYAVYHLQRKDTPTNPAQIAALGLQMGQRAAKLGLTSQSAISAWTTAQTLLDSPVPPPSVSPIVFSGVNASDLNRFLNATAAPFVRVSSPAINIDQAIRIPRDGLTIDFGSATLTTSVSPAPPYFLRLEGVNNVAILGGIFSGGTAAVLVNKSANVLIDHAQISGFALGGIYIAASSKAMAAHNRISGMGSAGIIVGTGTTLTTVQQNDISSNLGASNWSAAIVLTDRDVDYAANPQALLAFNKYGPPLELITQRLKSPLDCLVAFNHLYQNVSSGIYVDGAARMVIYGNQIIGNAKEGLCLDNGATADVVASNVIQQNGKRWGQTDAVLSLDYVLARLPDGTAVAKLPGISMDNSLYNVVFGNNISHNFGGGIKMVRTGYFNVIGLNTLESNNDGVSSYFRFFAVQLGAAPPDLSVPDLDFTASRGNIVFSNVIRGSNSSGLFVQLGSDENEISDNVILDAQMFAIESVAWMSNLVRNNTTDAPSQDVGTDCCSLVNRRPKLGR